MNMNNGRKEDRQKEAKERREARESITNKQQLKNLDAILGVGVGAIKERRILKVRIEKGDK